MKTEKEITEFLKKWGIHIDGCHSIAKEIILLQKEAYLQGQLDEFKENQIRTNKLLERFGI